MTHQDEQAICAFLRWASGTKGVVLASWYEERGLSALQGTNLEQLLTEYREFTQPYEDGDDGLDQGIDPNTGVEVIDYPDDEYP